LIARLEQDGIDKTKMFPPNSSPFCLCHDDLYLGNLLVDSNTGRITAVLDWDRAHWGKHNDFIRDWAKSLIGELFDGEEAERAQEELEKDDEDH
jgi:aminoglycoside phosphotransferase (APT) family kinase protein